MSFRTIVTYSVGILFLLVAVSCQRASPVNTGEPMIVGENGIYPVSCIQQQAATIRGQGTRALDNCDVSSSGTQSSKLRGLYYGYGYYNYYYPYVFYQPYSYGYNYSYQPSDAWFCNSLYLPSGCSTYFGSNSWYTGNSSYYQSSCAGYVQYGWSYTFPGSCYTPGQTIAQQPSSVTPPVPSTCFCDVSVFANGQGVGRGQAIPVGSGLSVLASATVSQSGYVLQISVQAPDGSWPLPNTQAGSGQSVFVAPTTPGAYTAYCAVYAAGSAPSSGGVGASNVCRNTYNWTEQ